MFDGSDGFPFVIGGSMTSVTSLHPPAVQIFQLWQIYLDNVNPLLKLTHTPTLQGQLIEAAANPSKISKPLEALLFSIYFIAIVSLNDEEALETFKEDKTRLISRYHRGTQQALINAGFMRSPDIVVLQAFVIYLVSSLLAPFTRDDLWILKNQSSESLSTLARSDVATLSEGFLTLPDLCTPIRRPTRPFLFNRHRRSGCHSAWTAPRCRAISPSTF